MMEQLMEEITETMETGYLELIDKIVDPTKLEKITNRVRERTKLLKNKINIDKNLDEVSKILSVKLEEISINKLVEGKQYLCCSRFADCLYQIEIIKIGETIKSRLIDNPLLRYLGYFAYCSCESCQEIVFDKSFTFYEMNKIEI